MRTTHRAFWKTNSNSLRPSLLPPPPPLPPHLSDDTPTMESTPPPLPPRVTASPAATPRNPLGGPARDIHWTRPPDNGNPDPPSALDTPLYSVPPPRPHPRDFYKRLPRSKTVDIGEHERHSQYDSLPVRRPEWSPERSRSMDVVDVNEDYMVGSAAGIRELLQQGSALSKNNSNRDVVDGNGEEDDLHDMPDSSPPPVPTKHNPFIDSTYGEIPFKKQTQHPQENAMPPQRCSIRDADYMIMKPQTDSDLKREYSQLSSAQTDYAVVPVLSSTNIPRGDSNHKSSATSTSNENVAPSIDQGSDKDKALYHRMHPARVKAKSKDSSTFNFLRTKSAHLLRRPAFLLKTRPPRPKRRGTVSTASLLRSGEQDGGSSSLPRSGDQRSGGGQADTHGMRRSRSFDDILQDQDWTMPQEAESLQDLLARASISPGERHSQPDPRSGYLVPPSARRKAPLLPSPEAHQFYQTPPSRSSSRSSPSPPLPPHSQQGEGEGEGEAAYLDMSQASLERRKNKHKKVTSTQSYPASTSPSSNRSQPVSTSPSSNRSRPVSTSPSSNRPTHSLSPRAASTAQTATSTPDHSPVLHPSSANRIKPVPGSLLEPAAAVCRIALYSPNDDEVDL